MINFAKFLRQHPPGQIRQWLDSARQFPGIQGVTHTTWVSRYSDLEVVSTFEVTNSRACVLRPVKSGLQVEVPVLTSHAYQLQRSTELGTWEAWTIFTIANPAARRIDTGATPGSRR